MPKSTDAVWEGNLAWVPDDKRRQRRFEGPYSFKSRFEEGISDQPRRAARRRRSGCSMALTAQLSRVQLSQTIHTKARVKIEQVGAIFDHAD
jgi:hypothetical protein